jgi:hypothetical protein
MAQSDEPIEVETVLEEVFAALEAMAQDADSELGEFEVMPNERISNQCFLIVGDKKFVLTISEQVY